MRDSIIRRTVMKVPILKTTSKIIYDYLLNKEIEGYITITDNDRTVLQTLILPVKTNISNCLTRLISIGLFKKVPKIEPVKKERTKYLQYEVDTIEYRRAAYLHSCYKLTVKEYEDLFKSQEGKCAICKNKGATNLSVDHCHTTGKVRGLLCHTCNVGLGFFKDSVFNIREAEQYLTKHLD